MVNADCPYCAPDEACYWHLYYTPAACQRIYQEGRDDATVGRKPRSEHPDYRRGYKSWVRSVNATLNNGVPTTISYPVRIIT
jgi:hypothetical protein